MSKKLRKLLIVSNRLPITVSKENGKIRYKKSFGGLATSLSAANKNFDSLWVGWPGISREELSAKELKEVTRELKRRGCHPIFLSKLQIEQFYSGYSNSVLWPLFHYAVQRTEYVSSHWKAYQDVNRLFSSVVSKLSQADTNIWVHDYQMMLLPAMLRKKLPNATIGFFLHIPFPSSEIFRLLPQRKEILEGLLGADLIGFHTYDYAHYFTSSVLRILGNESVAGSIAIGDRFVQVDVFPIGIDYKKYASAASHPKTKRQIKDLKNIAKGQRVILSFDRADYTKGIPGRLAAYQQFLKDNPAYHKKVVMIMAAAPTRADVAAYQDLRIEIEQKVKEINDKYSTAKWTPISYSYRAFDFNEVIALYDMADVMLVTPLRDGLNLMAKEFVAVKQSGKGVLILSEMTGAASELQEAIQVVPNNQQMVADAIKQALTMPQSEQKRHLLKMQERISKYTAFKWADDFTTQLDLAKNKQAQKLKLITAGQKQNLLKLYKKSKKRLFLLDYDGTLMDFSLSPDAVSSQPTKKLRRLLAKIMSDKRNKVVIISGRPKSILSTWFKSTSLGLVAEHGGWVNMKDRWVKAKIPSTSWKKQFRPLLEYFTDRTPGSFVEEKDFALVWHYRRVNPDLAYIRTPELLAELKILGSGRNIGVFEGSKIVEIKPTGIDKGAVAMEFLRNGDWDFVFAIGDDYTDEDMFKILPTWAHTVKIGTQPSDARYQVSSVAAATLLLEEIARGQK